MLERILKSYQNENVEHSDLKIYFYSKKMTDGIEINITDIRDLKKTDFSYSKKTIFVIHGWHDDYNASMCQTVKNAYLTATDVNIFLVDWSSIAQKAYIIARSQVFQVGRALGLMISSMVYNQLLNLDNTSVVGHSLGAHVAGNAGHTLGGKVDHIIGKFRNGQKYFCSFEYTVFFVTVKLLEVNF